MIIGVFNEKIVCVAKVSTEWKSGLADRNSQGGSKIKLSGKCKAIKILQGNYDRFNLH